MKALHMTLAVVFFATLQSCGTLKSKNNTETLWVNSEKTPCSAGAGKAQCMRVYKGKDLANANWQLFYNNIEGFEFQEGVYQKIKVKVETLDKAQVPADASTLKYTLIEVMETKADKKMALNGDWNLIRLNGAPLNRMVAIPSLTINLSQKMFSGNNGCNNYSAQIHKVDQTVFNLGAVATTRKACIGKNLETAYNTALGQIASYKITDLNLMFYDASGNEILAFLKSENTQVNININDIWVATTINGSPINRMVAVPRLEVNLSSMKVMGTDGCNNFMGNIKSIGKSNIELGALAGTKKACVTKNVASEFNYAMSKVAAYRIEDTTLMLLDKNGSELLTFLKVD